MSDCSDGGTDYNHVYKDHEDSGDPRYYDDYDHYDDGYDYESYAARRPTTQSTYRVDLVYKNPTAVVSLISSDKVRFRVDLWNLDKKSPIIDRFIAHVWDAPNAIYLDASAITVRHYLNAVYSDDITGLDDELDLLKFILGICDKIASPRIRARVLSSFGSLARTQPWWDLIIASDRNDVALAKETIRRLPEDQTELFNILVYRSFDSAKVQIIRTSWMAEIFRLRSGPPNPMASTESGSIKFKVVPWEQVVVNFSPAGQPSRGFFGGCYIS